MQKDKSYTASSIYGKKLVGGEPEKRAVKKLPCDDVPFSNVDFVVVKIVPPTFNRIMDVLAGGSMCNVLRARKDTTITVFWPQYEFC